MVVGDGGSGSCCNCGGCWMVFFFGVCVCVFGGGGWQLVVSVAMAMGLLG